MVRPFTRVGVALLAAAVIVSTAACGSGFEEEQQQQGGKADLQILIGSSGDAETNAVKAAAALLATIPVAIIFFVFQRYFVRGANEGSAKG